MTEDQSPHRPEVDMVKDTGHDHIPRNDIINKEASVHHHRGPCHQRQKETMVGMRIVGQGKFFLYDHI